MPSLQHEVILGIDFRRLWGLVPDVLKGTCKISEDCEAPLVNEIVVSHEKLSKQEKKDLEKLIEKYKPTLGRSGLGCTDRLTHNIDTGDAEPVRQRYHSYSPKMLEVMHSGLDDYLAQDIVEPSSSTWASGVMLLPKPDGSRRWIVDLRNVNKCIKADRYPLPKVSDILDQLKDARFISSIDLTSAYFQIPLSESSKEKPAFIVPGRGLFQFKRMPHGLHTAPATWQRFIDTIGFKAFCFCVS